MYQSTGELKWGLWWAVLVGNNYRYGNVLLALNGGSPSIELFYDTSAIKLGIEISFQHLALRFGMVHLVLNYTGEY